MIDYMALFDQAHATDQNYKKVINRIKKELKITEKEATQLYASWGKVRGY